MTYYEGTTYIVVNSIAACYPEEYFTYVSYDVAGAVEPPPGTLDFTAAVRFDVAASARMNFTADASFAVETFLSGVSSSHDYPILYTRVPCLTPKFQFSVYASEIAASFLCQLQVSTDPLFSSQETWSPVTFLPEGVTGELTTVPAGSSLADDAVYYWRTRVGRNDSWADWTTNSAFVTDTQYGKGFQYGAAADVVSSSAISPVLWFMSDDEVEPGDVVTAYGRGLSECAIVGFGDTEFVPDSVVSFPGTGDEFTASRAIVPGEGIITVSHDRVVFTIPADIDENEDSAIYLGVGA